ncbi:large-conductance mechanosensitive channel, partial [Lobosporangium transversale]
FADYRKFMDRGNVIDLAVAVVIGAAFTAIVTSLVADIITPVLALASGKNLEENFVILRKSDNATAEYVSYPTTRQAAKDAGNITWNWGNFLQTVINFFIVSACVFLLVKLYEVARNKKTEVSEKKCEYCLKSIPLDAVRCPNCTTWLDWDACAKAANMERIAASSFSGMSMPMSMPIPMPMPMPMPTPMSMPIPMSNTNVDTPLD